MQLKVRRVSVGSLSSDESVEIVSPDVSLNNLASQNESINSINESLNKSIDTINDPLNRSVRSTRSEDCRFSTKSILIDNLNLKFDLKIQNFTSDFKDGWKILSMINTFKPNLGLLEKGEEFDKDYERLKFAVDCAKHYLGVSKFINEDDINQPNPDAKSLFIYFYQFLEKSIDESLYEVKRDDMDLEDGSIVDKCNLVKEFTYKAILSMENNNALIGLEDEFLNLLPIYKKISNYLDNDQQSNWKLIEAQITKKSIQLKADKSRIRKPTNDLNNNPTKKLKKMQHLDKLKTLEIEASSLAAKCQNNIYVMNISSGNRKRNQYHLNESKINKSLDKNGLKRSSTELNFISEQDSSDLSNESFVANDLNNNILMTDQHSSTIDLSDDDNQKINQNKIKLKSSKKSQLIQRTILKDAESTDELSFKNFFNDGFIADKTLIDQQSNQSKSRSMFSHSSEDTDSTDELNSSFNDLFNDAFIADESLISQEASLNDTKSKDEQDLSVIESLDQEISLNKSISKVSDLLEDTRLTDELDSNAVDKFNDAFIADESFVSQGTGSNDSKSADKKNLSFFNDSFTINKVLVNQDNLTDNEIMNSLNLNKEFNEKSETNFIIKSNPNGLYQCNQIHSDFSNHLNSKYLIRKSGNKRLKIEIYWKTKIANHLSFFYKMAVSFTFVFLLVLFISNLMKDFYICRC